MTYFLLLLALIGHTALWACVVNQIHATRLAKLGVTIVNILGLGSLCAAPLVYMLWFWRDGLDWLSATPAGPAVWYFLCCCVLGVPGLAVWANRNLRRGPLRPLKRQSAQRLDMVRRLGYRPDGNSWLRPLTRLPGNECFQLEITEKELELSRLPARLDGLTIAHLSDLHFTGIIDRRYFVEVAELTSALEPDLILITGDLVDRPECIDWSSDVFGRLRAKYGSFFVFGNHDVRLKSHLPRLRQAIVDAGTRYLGARHQELCIEGETILLAGNELPWIRPAADMTRIDDATALRVLLAHTPDQLPWARRHGFDLMLAGHNHGGQIRLPLVGPLFSPSRYGVKYACGLFHEPPTLMHVSRGVSALDPLRYNCPPELTRIVLRSPVANDEPARIARPLAQAVAARS
ncbi:MAG: metallophosphoesterase [Pirellulales bacterium]|nr:metallophosphoesterase [Pirellulales bacterium]